MTVEKEGTDILYRVIRKDFTKKVTSDRDMKCMTVSEPICCLDKSIADRGNSKCKDSQQRGQVHGSSLQSQPLGRLTSGVSWFETSPDKKLARPLLNKQAGCSDSCL
jgi:hypothetical protein